MTPWLLGPADVRRLLPQQPPFLFIDTIASYRPGERLVATKAVTLGESHFAGHFAELPIMPGVLVVEALAQAACALSVLDALAWQPGAAARAVDLPLDTTPVLGSMRMTFLAPVFPGSVIRLEVELCERRAAGAFFDVCATVDDIPVVRGSLTVALAQRSLLERTKET